MIADEDFSGSPTDEVDDRWEAAMADFYVPVRVRVDRNTLDTAPNFLRRYEVEDLAIVELGCTAAAVHGGGFGVEDAGDDLALIIVEHGEERVSSGDRQRRLTTGDVVLWDPRQPVSFSVESRVLKRNLLIPRGELRAAVGRDVDLTGVPLGGPCVLMLNSMVCSFIGALPEMSPTEARSVRNALVELVAGAIRNGAGVPESARGQLRASVVAWVEQNLTRELTPALVAAEHAISVRTLNRLFSETGETLGTHVRDKRLECARDDVVGTDLPLTAIAYRWRFSDGSHFTRQFVGRFGASPNSLRRIGR